jgi:calcineurin-like phosphoesterase family protein
MLKTLKFNGQLTDYHVVSDLHINHPKSFIFQARGYNSQQEHDEGIVKVWNERVKPTDTVFNLGDTYTYSNKSEDAENFLRQLNFSTFYTLWGNHPASMKQMYFEEVKRQYGTDSIEVYPLTKILNNDKKIVFLGDYVEMYLNGEHYILSHFSLRSWHKNGKSSKCLVGHSHGGDKEINPDDFSQKQLDCGIDNFGGPVNFAEIKRIMDKKQVRVYDHHSAETN